MLGVTRRIVPVLVIFAAIAAAPGLAQTTQVPHGPAVPLDQLDWTDVFCRYALHDRGKSTARTMAAARATTIAEVEPNDFFANAMNLGTSLIPGPTKPVDVDIKGSIDYGADEDLYLFEVNKGDILGVAVLAGDDFIDPVLTIEQTNSTPLIENDNHQYIDYVYPVEAPWPVGVRIYDSALTWMVPAKGKYLLRVKSYALSSRGDYTIQIRSRRPSFENQNIGSKQIIFLDFNGAIVNALELFGEGNSAANLSPLYEFLPYWGLTRQDEPAVIDAIIEESQAKLDALRLASLNGNLPTDNVLGHFDVELRNSRDDPDPWGEANVSRVVIGGTQVELGISTIGISESIDPGNFAREETAVVLLDTMAGMPIDPYSINNIRLASGLTIIDAIGRSVATIVVHEAGHYLGNWHTDYLNDVTCIMDKYFLSMGMAAGTGPDNILGTTDDEDVLFVPDMYSPLENIAVGEEMTDLQTAFADATGRVLRGGVDGGEDTGTVTFPLGAIRAAPTAGSAPLYVEFAAGEVDDQTGELYDYAWDFGDPAFDPAAQPECTLNRATTCYTYQSAGEFTVTVTVIRQSDGATAQATTIISVTGLNPTARVSATPTRGTVPLTVQFDGTGSQDVDGEVVAYAWEFGDGESGEGAAPSHTYTTAGYYPARLTVTDDSGATSSATLLITVLSPSSSSTTDSGATTSDNTGSTTAPMCGMGALSAVFGSFVGLTALSRRRRR